MSAKVTILGSGSAYGVPFLGGEWGNCDPNNPRNRRTAPSILLESGATRLLVDMGPDIKAQAENIDIGNLDGIFFTHPHFDHIGGMGHLPVMMYHYQDKNLPLYANRFTRKEIEKNWWYLFDPKINVQYSGPGRPYFTEVLPYSSLQIGDMSILPFEQNHGSMISLGLRYGDFAYCTDVRSFPEKSFDLLYDLDVFVVDCNQEADKDNAHSYLEQCLSWVEQLKPKQTYLTHLNYTVDYEDLSARLPKNVALAYDGLEITL